MTFPTLITLLGGALLVEILYTHRQLRRVIARSERNGHVLRAYPSITVVRPVRGRDVDAERNFAAALDTGYPGEVETLFVFDDEHDPGYAVACEVVRRHLAEGRPGTARVVTAGPPPRGMTGKLHAMIVGEKLARGTLIAFGDSDTRPDRHVLRILVEELEADPKAGATFAPVVVCNPAEKAGDVGYAMLINAWYGASVAVAAGARGELPFIMGQIMVFTRAAITAIGGLECAEGQLTDDMYLGRRVAEAGLKNVMITRPLYITTGGMSYGAFLRLFRRWLLFSVNGLPAAFTAPSIIRGLELWVALVAIGVAFAADAPAGAIVPALALGASVWTQIDLHRRLGGAPLPLRYLWVPFSVPTVGPFIALTMLASRRVSWRGRAYTLEDVKAHLATE